MWLCVRLRGGREALSPAEVRQLYQAGTNGMSLAQLVSANSIAIDSEATNAREINLRFQLDKPISNGQVFLLRSSPHPAGPYLDHPAVPIRDKNAVRFSVPLESNAPSKFFQIVRP